MNTNATISVMLVCQFVYAEPLFDFEGWLEKAVHRKILVMDCLYACNFIKKWLQHRCFPVNFANFQEQLLCKKHLQTDVVFWLYENLWCNKVLPYPCSIKDRLTYLNLVSHLPKKLFYICFNDNPSKMMKNAFYFILKMLFVLRIFRFLSWLFGHVEKTA